MLILAQKKEKKRNMMLIMFGLGAVVYDLMLECGVTLFCVNENSFIQKHTKEEDKDKKFCRKKKKIEVVGP